MLQLYRAMRDFERRLTIEAGPFSFTGGTIGFGKRVDAGDAKWHKSRVDLIQAPATKTLLKAVAAARSALFHGGDIDVAASLVAMRQVLGLLAGINTNAGDEFKASAGVPVVWPWPEELQNFLAAPAAMAQIRVVLAVLCTE